MKAIVVRHAGGPEVLEYSEVPTPQVKDGWTRVKVHGFGINHSEIYTRKGESPSVHFPRILGIECVGEVDETSDPKKFHKGEKVVSTMGGMGREFDGGYAQYALLPNKRIFPVTTSLSWADLAAIPETYYTAFGSIRPLRLTANKRVLIRPGSSGVGVAAAKLIANQEPSTEIIGTTRSPAKVDELKSHGFTDVIVTPNAAVLPSGSRTFDGIIDLVGSLSVRDSLKHLRKGGVVTVTGGLGNQWGIPNFEPISEIPNDCYLTGFTSGGDSTRVMQELIDFIEKHHVDVSPTKVFTLEHTVQAHEFVEGNHSFGKVVVLPWATQGDESHAE